MDETAIVEGLVPPPPGVFGKECAELTKEWGYAELRIEKSAQSIENKGARFSRSGGLMEPGRGDGRGLEREGRGREFTPSAAGKWLGRGRGARFMGHHSTGSIPCQYSVLYGMHSNGALPEGRPAASDRGQQSVRKTTALPAGQPATPVPPCQEIQRRPGCMAGRVTRGWRFYFKIKRDEYVILSIIPHPK
jgi:hypothetical protein